MTTEETKAPSNQSEQPNGTNQGKETDASKKDEYIIEGKRKRDREIAQQLGYKNLDVDKIAAALKFQKEAEDAQKTSEERLVEIGQQNQGLSEENESLKSIIASRAEADFNALSDEAKGFVSEFAGDDPIARMKYMGSESFQKLVQKQAPRTQGSIQNAPDSGNDGDIDAEYDKKWNQMMASTNQEEKRRLSQELQEMGKRRSNKTFSGLLPTK